MRGSGISQGGETLMKLEGLEVWYRPGQNVLSGLSLELKEHETVGLIGLNGAGKTTLIKTLSGLSEHFRAQTVLWEGKPLLFRGKEFKKQRYTVFAEDRSFSYFTFREYLDYAAASYGKELPDVSDLARGFHFEEYTDVPLGRLSTGNLKKAYLITAFALRPRLLLLDEPVNGLDFQSTEYLYELMKEYGRHGALLFSSHILESICMTSDRVLVLEEGRIGKSFAGREIAADTIREELSEYENV